MPTEFPKAKGRLFNVIAIGVIIVAALAYKPVRVFYHRSAVQRAWQSTVQQGGSNSQDLITFEQHRDSLVKLGYFTKQVFPTPPILPRSAQERALMDALNDQASKAGGYFSVQGFETSAAPVVIVWAIPAQMADWEKIVQTHAPITRK